MMEILLNMPLIPHNCTTEIVRDPRSKELGIGSQVRCSCNRTYILDSDMRGERVWLAHTWQGGR